MSSIGGHSGLGPTAELFTAASHSGPVTKGKCGRPMLSCRKKGAPALARPARAASPRARSHAAASPASTAASGEGPALLPVDEEGRPIVSSGRSAARSTQRVSGPPWSLPPVLFE